jgi:hypothetical protein
VTEAYAVPVPKGYRVGDWEVREPIATGAFGSVYEGRRRSAGGGAGDLPATAALKFLPTGTGTPRQLTHLRELIDREVELHRRLSRPRLIRMYDTLSPSTTRPAPAWTAPPSSYWSGRSGRWPRCRGGPRTGPRCSRRSARDWHSCTRRAGCTVI